MRQGWLLTFSLALPLAALLVQPSPVFSFRDLPPRRFLGSVEVPKLFLIDSPASRGGIPSVTLYVEPARHPKVKVVIHDPMQVAAIEHGYEELSAIVISTSSFADHAWFEVQYSMD